MYIALIPVNELQYSSSMYSHFEFSPYMQHPPLQISPLLSPGVLGTPAAAAASATKGGSVLTPPRLRRTPAGGGEASQHKKTPTPALKTKSMCNYICNSTIDWETFTLKIIYVENFHVVKFLWFCSIHKIFLMVDDCNMDEHLESSWLLVYYQVSREPEIAGLSHRSDIYLGECGLVHKLIH